jgi:hypothetical protein
MAQLFRQTLGHNVDSLVKIVTVIFPVDIRPSQSKMHFDHKGVLECPFIIVPKGHMRADQIQPKMFQTFDLLGDIGMDGGSELYIPGTDMNLHILSYLQVPKMSIQLSKLQKVPRRPYLPAVAFVEDIDAVLPA